MGFLTVTFPGYSTTYSIYYTRQAASQYKSEINSCNKIQILMIPKSNWLVSYLSEYHSEKKLLHENSQKHIWKNVTDRQK